MESAPERFRGDAFQAMTGQREVGDFPIWIVALKSGFIPFRTFQQWVDAQVLRRDPPPAWLLDLALAADVDVARHFLWQTWSELATPDERDDFPDFWGLFVGFLYLRYERGESSLDELLAQLNEIPMREADAMGLVHLTKGDEAAQVAPFAIAARKVVGRLPRLAPESEAP